MRGLALPKKKDGPTRILVADDERHILRLIQVSLERQGYAVTCAADGREAIDLLQSESFDLAVIDLMMPFVDGYQVLTWIRTQEKTMDLRVVLMVDNAEEWESRTDLPHQADLYLNKPFNPNQVLQ